MRYCIGLRGALRLQGGFGNSVSEFAHDTRGNVTADFVVIVASIIGFGVAGMSAVTSGAVRFSDDTSVAISDAGDTFGVGGTEPVSGLSDQAGGSAPAQSGSDESSGSKNGASSDAKAEKKAKRQAEKAAKRAAKKAERKAARKAKKAKKAKKN